MKECCLSSRILPSNEELAINETCDTVRIHEPSMNSRSCRARPWLMHPFHWTWPVGQRSDSATALPTLRPVMPSLSAPWLFLVNEATQIGRRKKPHSHSLSSPSPSLSDDGMGWGGVGRDRGKDRSRTMRKEPYTILELHFLSTIKICRNSST